MGTLPHVRRLPAHILLLLVVSVSCQPICGLVFTVVLPDGAAETSSLRVEAPAGTSLGEQVQPDRSNVARTERGFVVEVAYFEPGVDVAPRVWVDVDGDGERGPGDLAADLGRTHLDGAGCDGMTTLERPVVLTPIPTGAL